MISWAALAGPPVYTKSHVTEAECLGKAKEVLINGVST
jgi:hypothetical protein